MSPKLFTKFTLLRSSILACLVGGTALPAYVFAQNASFECPIRIQGFSCDQYRGEDFYQSTFKKGAQNLQEFGCYLGEVAYCVSEDAKKAGSGEDLICTTQIQDCTELRGADSYTSTLAEAAADPAKLRCLLPSLAFCITEDLQDKVFPHGTGESSLDKALAENEKLKTRIQRLQQKLKNKK